MSIAVARGQIVGLLGPNGAGKSTALLAMAGGLMPSAGTIRIAGHDLARAPLEAKRRLDDGETMETVVEYLNDKYARMEILLTAYTLKVIRKSGRISAAAASIS